MSAAVRDDLLRPALKFTGAVLVVAGPWLVFVSVFGLASLRLEPLMGRLALEDLRLTVVYAFCLAPLVAGPIASIAARIVDLESETSYFSLSGILLSALGLATGLAMAVAGIVALALGIAPTDLAVAFVFFSGAVAQLWVVFAVLAARRAFGFLMAGFVGCLGGASAALLGLARWDTPVSHLVWLMYAGIVLYVVLAVACMARQETDRADISGDFGKLLQHFTRHRTLAFGIFCALAAVWADKWLMWFGPSGMQTTAGFYHFAPYDTVMFLAHLTTIPAFAALHVFQRTTLARTMSRIFRRLADGSNLRTVDAEVAAAQRVIWGGLLYIVAIQLAVTTCALFVIPWVAAAMSLDFWQVLTLRIGLLAVFSYSLLILSNVVLLQTRSTRFYLAINILMLVLNVLVGVAMSSAVWGLFTAAFFSALVSLILAVRELNRAVYLNFIGEREVSI